MTTQTSQVIAIPPDPGYAPRFAVDVEGKPVDERTKKNDVLDIHVVLDLPNMGSFDITFNNWDDVHRRFSESSGVGGGYRGVQDRPAGGRAARLRGQAGSGGGGADHHAESHLP